MIDDFAHHPTAIRETLGALKGRFGPGKLLAAFEPRSATSRRAVFQTEFADALTVADEVVLAPLYAPEKVPRPSAWTSSAWPPTCAARTSPPASSPTVDETVNHLADRAVPGDTIVVMSSGDYGGLHDKLLAKLGDPVRPRASPTSPASRTCSTASASPTRCSSSSGRTTWSSPTRPPTRRRAP